MNALLIVVTAVWLLAGIAYALHALRGREWIYAFEGLFVIPSMVIVWPVYLIMDGLLNVRKFRNPFFRK